jgi:hypothetical protein
MLLIVLIKLKMKKYFRQTLTALLCGAMFFASCKDDSEVVKSSDCKIVSFSVNSIAWNIGETDITHTYPPDIQEGLLTPVITLSPGATVNPASGTEQNFFMSPGVTYFVTAEDGVTKKIYTASATRTQGTESEILSFSVNGVAWTINNTLITHVYPAGTTEGTLTPTITLSPGATVDPPADAAQNFFTENGVRYTVTSENGAWTKTYTVKARTISGDSDIISFAVDGTEWKINGTDITCVYPPEITETTLTPTITLSPGATVNPPADVPQNFFTGQGVRYTVTSEDGAATKTYTVKATIKTIRKYAMHDWTVATRNRHGWDDGIGDQTLWPGGHPMLILDNDSVSGWHSPLREPFPHVIIVDMKTSNPIYRIHADGGYWHHLQIYLTDELPFSGYVSHTVDWDDENNRENNYEQWLSLIGNLMPSGYDMPVLSWGAPIVDVTLPVSNTFTFNFGESVQGRYLIFLFPDNDSNGYSTYCDMTTLGVYE